MNTKRREVPDALESAAYNRGLYVNADFERVDLCVVLRSEIVPFTQGGRQANISCAPIFAGGRSANGFRLILHELMVHAVKFGALSTPAGSLSVACFTHETGLRLVWREAWTSSRDVRLSKPSKVLIQSLATDLNGHADFKVRALGLTARIDIDLESTSPQGLPTRARRLSRPTIAS